MSLSPILMLKKGRPELCIRFVYFAKQFGGHLQANAMCMKFFTHMSCKSIRLLETIFSSCKTMPAYLQFGKKLFASWSCHNPLTGLLGPDPSPIGHPWDILGRGYMILSLPSCHMAMYSTGGRRIQLLLNMCKRLIECIHKGGGYTRYD